MSIYPAAAAGVPRCDIEIYPGYEAVRYFTWPDPEQMPADPIAVVGATSFSPTAVDVDSGTIEFTFPADLIDQVGESWTLVELAGLDSSPIVGGQITRWAAGVGPGQPQEVVVRAGPDGAVVVEPAGRRGARGAAGLDGAAAMGNIDGTDTVATTVVGAGVEREIWAASVPAGRVAGGDSLVMRIPAGVTISTSTATAIWRAYLDGVEILESGAQSLGASSQTREALIDLTVEVGPGATSQTVSIEVQVATAIAGVDIEVEASTLIGTNHATANLNDGGIISVTVEFSTATASVTRESGRLRLIQAAATIQPVVEPSTEQLDDAVAAGVMESNGWASTIELFDCIRTTSNVTVTANTTAVSDLTDEVPANLGRPVYIHYGAQVGNDVVGGNADLQLWESVAGAAFTLADRVPWRAPIAHAASPNTALYRVSGIYRVSPSVPEAASDRAYQVRLRASSITGGTATLDPDVDCPAFMRGVQM